jgi:phosphatidylglycerol:prolipoprotein diacylglycerol transferase
VSWQGDPSLFGLIERQLFPILVGGIRGIKPWRGCHPLLEAVPNAAREDNCGMELMAIPFPGIDPVAVAIGPVQVRWYGLAYLAGLTLGWLYMRALLRNRKIWPGEPPMRAEQADDFLLWATLGTVVGGRLGYVLLYDTRLLITDPLQIFAVWQGGMSFHGGLLGVIAAILLFSRWNRIPTLSLGDVCAAVAPIGLFFGRVANFINGEVYGRLTSVPWAVEFPASVLRPGDPFGPRHPTQLYEALLEGVVLFLVLRYFTHRRGSLSAPGLTAGIFLLGYGVSRILAEFTKAWNQLHPLTTDYTSPGMIYSLPMVALGIYFIAASTRRRTLAIQ